MGVGGDIAKGVIVQVVSGVLIFFIVSAIIVGIIYFFFNSDFISSWLRDFIRGLLGLN
jgi:hypothetical protein